MEKTRKYDPPIEERETELLIGMSWNCDEYWHPEASQLAKEELNKRGVSKEFQNRLISQWEDELKEAKKKRDAELKSNKLEKYNLFDLITIFVLSPILLTGKINYGLSLSELKKENYKVKFKQKRFVLALGILCFVLSIYIGMHTYGTDEGWKLIITAPNNK